MPSEYLTNGYLGSYMVLLSMRGAFFELEDAKLGEINQQEVMSNLSGQEESTDWVKPIRNMVKP